MGQDRPSIEGKVAQKNKEKEENNISFTPLSDALYG